MNLTRDLTHINTNVYTSTKRVVWAKLEERDVIMLKVSIK